MAAAPQSLFANGAQPGASEAQAIGVNKSASRSSFTFETGRSPDTRGMALERELGNITIDDEIGSNDSHTLGTPDAPRATEAWEPAKLRSHEPRQLPRAASTHPQHQDSASFGSRTMSVGAPNATVSACTSMGDLLRGLDKDVETAYGEPHPSRDVVRRARRIIVKVGTAVVTRERDQRLSLGRLGALVEQLETLVRSGRQVILVTSGGVGIGRQKLRQQQVLNSSPLEMQIQVPGAVSSRAAAAAGQSGLMALYDNLFGLMDLQSAQLLVTSNDFTEPAFRANLVASVEDLLSMNVVPVFNENDAISRGAAVKKDQDLPFWDNDSLAALLAVELKADLCMLMTDVDGLYTGPPSDPSSQLVSTYCPAIHDPLIRFGSKSTGGRGGMLAKVAAAWKAAEAGVTTVIAAGKGRDTILQAVAGQCVGTMFDRNAAAALQRQAEQLSGDGEATPRQAAAQLEADAGDARAKACAARNAARTLQALPSKARGQVLLRMAEALEARQEEILAENAADMRAAEERKVDDSLRQRLGLTPQKLKNVCAGIRAIAGQDEPVRRVLARRELAQGLVLEKVTAPIGVLLIIFEARPEALVQIAALAVRSGNGLLLKGGKEAARSNAVLHAILTDALEAALPAVGRGLVHLVTTRQGVDDLLGLDDVIDLVIPRGSNALVSHIQSHTRIPVMGHADGVCHLYVDAAADTDAAAALAVDSKTDYPAACNALETLLVHERLAADGRLFRIMGALRDAGVTIHGGERAAHALGLPTAPAAKHEYGEKALTLELVADMQQAVDHIHANGSGHTEAICTEDAAAGEEFLRLVDSACVHVNASTRFSDGFRYGLGAEVGIATGRLHARGPVGVEGLLTSKWLLRGGGHLVKKDTGVSYTHRELDVPRGSVSPQEAAPPGQNSAN